MMTVSAVARLIPRPPARVESRKANWGAPGAGRRDGGTPVKYRRSGNFRSYKKNRLLNFRIVLFSSPRHTGSVASNLFLSFDVEN